MGCYCLYTFCSFHKFFKCGVDNVFDAAIDRKIIYLNPALKIKYTPFAKTAKCTTTELEEAAILNAYLTLKERTFLYLGLFASCRRGESLGLCIKSNRSSIDLKNRLTVHSG